jgi:hypothetical protein
VKTCRFCFWDIREDERGWVLAWWIPADANEVPDPYACAGHEGHEPEEDR